MKKKWITETRPFVREVDKYIEKRRLLKKDYESFKKRLVENPQEGRLIPGMGGIRKIRLKSSMKGKRGGFRVCYLDDEKNEEIFLLIIYSKNEKENYSSEEKKVLCNFVKDVKRG